MPVPRSAAFSARSERAPATFRLILGLAGNRPIEQAFTNLSFSILRYGYFGISHRVQRRAQEHLDIIAALLQRDLAAADGAMVGHPDRFTEDRPRLLIPGS